MLLIIGRRAGVVVRNTLRPSVLGLTECHSWLSPFTLAWQALDFGARLEHFPARVLDWVNQLRGGAARTTDMYQMANHDHLGLPRRSRFGKRRGNRSIPLWHQLCSRQTGQLRLIRDHGLLMLGVHLKPAITHPKIPVYST